MLNSTTNAGTILIVDDDSEIREVLNILLSNENFQVIEAASPAEALEQLSLQIDLVILDVMMPEMSGYELCKKIRDKHNVPILFLTVKSNNSDLIMGYSSGGDDYLTKPFSYSELIARVKGLTRRYMIYQGKNVPTLKEEFLEFGPIYLNCTQNEVIKNHNITLSLTNAEYSILKLLMTYPKRIFSAQMIYENVWDEPYLPKSSNTIMVLIRRIREKIEDDPKHPVLLTTVWGRGYRFG